MIIHARVLLVVLFLWVLSATSRKSKAMRPSSIIDTLPTMLLLSSTIWMFENSDANIDLFTDIWFTTESTRSPSTASSEQDGVYMKINFRFIVYVCIMGMLGLLLIISMLMFTYAILGGFNMLLAWKLGWVVPNPIVYIMAAFCSIPVCLHLCKRAFPLVWELCPPMKNAWRRWSTGWGAMRWLRSFCSHLTPFHYNNAGTYESPSDLLFNTQGAYNGHWRIASSGKPYASTGKRRLGRKIHGLSECAHEWHFLLEWPGMGQGRRLRGAMYRFHRANKGNAPVGLGRARVRGACSPWRDWANAHGGNETLSHQLT